MVQNDILRVGCERTQCSTHMPTRRYTCLQSNKPIRASIMCVNGTIRDAIIAIESSYTAAGGCDTFIGQAINYEQVQMRLKNVSIV